MFSYATSIGEFERFIRVEDNIIIMAEWIIQCKSCKRILYTCNDIIHHSQRNEHFPIHDVAETCSRNNSQSFTDTPRLHWFYPRPK